MSQLPISLRHFRFHPVKRFANARLIRCVLLFLLPFPLVAIGIIFAVTCSNVETTLSSAIARNTLIQAHDMGYAISQTLEETRNQIAGLASGSTSLEELRMRLRRRMQALVALGDLRFREVAFVGTGSEANERFLWILDKSEVIDYPASRVDAVTNSPFHYGRMPKEHEIFLSQPTEVVYSLNSDEKNVPETQISMKVMRFVTPVILSDGRFAGYLILSIDLKLLRKTIAAFSLKTGSPDKAPIVLFVDQCGWMIFQMELNGSDASMPLDSVRSGLRGDFGRAGFGQAFRPKADYYGYWQMMNEINASTSSQFSTRKTAWNEGVQTAETVSYAPVRYSCGNNMDPTVLGGVVVLDPSFAGMRTGERLNNIYLSAFAAMLILVLLFTVSFAIWLRRSLARLRDDITHAGEQSLSTVLPARDEPEELREVRNTVNSLLTQMRSLEDERDIQDTLAHERMQQEEVPNMPRVIARPEDGIIGVSREMTIMREEIQRAAESQVDVLVMGETGTGKELTSRAVHSLSDRRNGPFITINCGALDESLLMDTLFGHVKGAFTEAKQSRKGAFLTAEGGTLMLDEIGTASPKVQAALLRTLSERCIYPLGSDTKIPFNTRVIAATNADLREEVSKGTFREDLYFRLAVITIQTPPLRQRKVDIPYLIMAFMQQAVDESGRARRAPGISKGALSELMHYHWPGNVRELKNVISRALAFCEGDIILPQHLRLGEQKEQEENSAKIAEATRAAVRAARRQSSEETDMDGAKSAHESARPLSEPASEPVTETPAPLSPVPPATQDASAIQTGKEAMLSERLRRLLPKLRSMGEFSRNTYQTLAKVSMRTAQYDLQELQSSGLAERRGKGPAQRYVMLDK